AILFEQRAAALPSNFFHRGSPSCRRYLAQRIDQRVGGPKHGLSFDMRPARAFDALIVGRVGSVADFDSYRVRIDAQQLGNDLAMHGVSAHSLVAHTAQEPKRSVALQ